MTFDELPLFAAHDMRTSHVVQPVMIRTLLDGGDTASTEHIARALLLEDRSRIAYYSEITRDMVGRVRRTRVMPSHSTHPLRLIAWWRANFPVSKDRVLGGGWSRHG